MFKGLGGLGDMAGMMAKAKEMQEKMMQAQEELDSIEVEGESGAGMVVVRVSAKGNVKGLTIDPSLFVPDDKEVVEDLIVAAIKDGQEKAAIRSKDEMAKITEGLGLPADMKLPF